MKRYVRKGVPSCHRRGVWLEVSGAAKLRLAEPDLYPTMLAMEVTSTLVDDQIRTRAVKEPLRSFTVPGWRKPQFHVCFTVFEYSFSIVSQYVLCCESASRRFQKGVGHSRVLLAKVR